MDHHWRLARFRRHVVRRIRPTCGQCGCGNRIGSSVATAAPAQRVGPRRKAAPLTSEADDFYALKLQKTTASGSRINSSRVVVERAEDAPATRARFSAGGLKKLRKRLALTREAFAPLLGVSSQTIYLWENGHARPRQESIDKLAIVRGMTKQQAHDVLAQHAPTTKQGEKRSRKPAAKQAASAAKKAAAKTTKKPVKVTVKKEAVARPTAWSRRSQRH
ncbi:helix-turn-helix transcriptional regulator [Lysobacter yananisis]|uniref:helix-turn-helix transcriptional regulator n=1 Tax=Lysobacter yananisis TaxID=1003114 RepID=UPI003CE4CBA4